METGKKPAFVKPAFFLFQLESLKLRLDLPEKAVTEGFQDSNAYSQFISFRRY